MRHLSILESTMPQGNWKWIICINVTYVYIVFTYLHSYNLYIYIYLYIDISHVDLQCMSFSPPFSRYESRVALEAWSDRASCATFLLIVLCGIAGGRGRPWVFVFGDHSNIILAIEQHIYKLVRLKLCYFYFFSEIWEDSQWRFKMLQ